MQFVCSIRTPKDAVNGPEFFSNRHWARRAKVDDGPVSPAFVLASMPAWVVLAMMHCAHESLD
jgi:hypothetical protein